MSHCDIRVLDRLGHSVSLIRAERTRSAFLILLFILCDEVILRFALFLVEADMQIIAIKKPIIGILYIILNTIVFSLSDRRYWLIHIKPHGEPFMYLAAAVYFTKETNPFFA